MGYLLGIDLGTSSVRAMIMAEEGKILAVAGQGYDVSIPKAGWAEQDPLLWYQKTAAAIKAALNSAGIAGDGVKALSFSGQMHGLVCLDRDGEPLRPAIIWPDTRSAGAIGEIYRLLGEELVRRETQNTISTGFLIASLYWLFRQEPETAERIHRVMLPKDYIKYRLTGELCTDYSDAAGSLAFNNVELCWSVPLLQGLGIPEEIFPPCLPAHQIVGQVSAKAAAETGLAAGTPVANGGADQCMQAIGNGIVEEGVFASNIGTGGQISTTLTRPLVDPGLRTNTFAHVLPGRWNAMGACLSSGASLKWLCHQVAGIEDYRLLDREAQRLPPGSEGLLFLPYLSGERTPHLDPLARGMFFGLTGKHGKYHLGRAVMEGVVFSLRDCMEVITVDQGVECRKVIASGGGASSDLWMQLQADILGREIYRSQAGEQASVGAAVTAGVACGVYTGFEAAVKQLVRLDETPFVPNRDNAEIYQEYYMLFRELYKTNRESFARLSRIIGGKQGRDVP